MGPEPAEEENLKFESQDSRLNPNPMAAQHSFQVRGIYEEEEASSPFAGGTVPAFETAEACRAWAAQHTSVCTNPAYAACKHIFTHACDWAQVRSLLLEPLARARAQYPVAPGPPAALPASNAFAAEQGVQAALRSRLDLPIHCCTSEESTLNTLRYLFFHMRHGIFVLIRRNRLIMFVPFVNKDYENLWGEALATEEPGGLEAYIEAKKQVLKDARKDSRPEIYIKDCSRWWANGNIMCNVASTNFWGDAYLAQLKHMLLALCAERAVPDCEFFINKRDFPQLKRNATEPYDFIYASDDAPLLREAYASYAPIASFFVGEDFADLPLVCTDDWETATGLVFPPNATDLRSAKNRKENSVAWADRVATAFFRGNSTGPGTDASSNQRLALAKLSAEWARSGSGYGADNSLGDGAPFLDAGVVGWNFRDRKLQGQPMTFIKPDTLGIKLVERVPMHKHVSRAAAGLLSWERASASLRERERERVSVLVCAHSSALLSLSLSLPSRAATSTRSM
jgi:hypothetical protein